MFRSFAASVGPKAGIKLVFVLYELQTVVFGRHRSFLYAAPKANLAREFLCLLDANYRATLGVGG